MNTLPEPPKPTFRDIGINQKINEILDQKKILHPTPIQAQSIPPVLEGSDCIGIAQTGTGKTLAFLLPIIQRMQESQAGRLLILAPTRELAQQTEETCRWFQKKFNLFSTVVVGGASMPRQISALRRKPQIIVATPGRLIDHLRQKTVNLSDVAFLVFDEADRMFDMGFAPQIEQIFEHLPKKDNRQTLLFSATMPDAIVQLVQEHMHNPIRVEIAAPGTVTTQVQQEIIIIDRAHRKEALLELLSQSNGAKLIFTRTKHQAKDLTHYLRTKKFRAEEIHGNRSQGQRIRAMQAIQSGRADILVATDIAARGIDIPHIEMVINFELPDQAEDYVHRIGRTGRASRTGRAVSIVLSDQQGELHAIQRLINKKIQITELEEVPTADLLPGVSKKKFRGGSYGGNRRGGSSARGGYNRSSRGRRSTGGARRVSSSRSRTASR